MVTERDSPRRKGTQVQFVALLRHLERRRRQRLAAFVEVSRLARHAGSGLVAVTLAVHLLAGLLPIGFIIGLGVAIRSLPTGDAAIWKALAFAGAMFVAAQALTPLQLLASQTIARRVDAYCGTRLIRSALTRAPLRTVERPEVADQLSDANEALQNAALTPGTATEGALALTARYSQLIAALALIWWTVGPLAVLAGATVALVNRKGQTAAFYRWGRLVRSLAPVRRGMAYVRDLATSTRAAREIRILGLVDWLDQRYLSESRRHLEPLWRWRRRVYGRPFALYAVVGLLATAGALALLVERPSASTDDLAAFVMGLQGIVVCARFGVIFPESDIKLVYGFSAWESLLKFERSCDEESVSVPAPARRSAPPPRRQIAVERVTFEYEPGKPVLRDLSLVVPVGRSTAIVGANGAGKTTLVKLLTGLYSPTRGRILHDGHDLSEEDPASWQRHFSVLSQGYLRYGLTLRENVGMGAVPALDDDAGMHLELGRAGLGELARSLPVGLDTPMTRSSPGGRELSGGQWQRVALARALFAVRHGASILVLDEPTAQLDARGEAEFYDSFVELTRGVTSVIIAHRLSSVRRADHIVVVEHGRVIERGTHDELIAAGETYAGLFEAQARRFVAAEG